MVRALTFCAHVHARAIHPACACARAIVVRRSCACSFCSFAVLIIFKAFINAIQIEKHRSDGGAQSVVRVGGRGSAVGSQGGPVSRASQNTRPIGSLRIVCYPRTVPP